MKDHNTSSELFNSLQLLQAYEQAIDENIISSITDTKGVIVHVNKKFCEVSKYSADEILGKNHNIIKSGFHSHTFFKNLWETIGSGQVWHNEIKNKAKDGSFYWVDTVIVPIKNHQNVNTHYLSLRTLITTRKLLEKNKEQYVSSLEVLLVMTSNKVKKPLAECLKQLNTFDPEKPSDITELKHIADSLKQSVFELDDYTKELTTFIREMEK